MRRKVANLDSRFVKIEEFKGEAFDLAVTFASGLPKITIPIGQTKHMNRYLGQGWIIGPSIRLGMDEKGVWSASWLGKRARRDSTSPLPHIARSTGGSSKAA